MYAPTTATYGGAPVIEELLPREVVSVEAFEDIVGERPHPDEESLIAGAMEKRRREFTTARRCARDALAGLGCERSAIFAGRKREPVWPVGVVGSITHCDGYRAAVCVRRPVLSSVGIDAEPHEPLPSGVLKSVTVPEERTALDALRLVDPSIHWDKLLFSAKESVYKALYPLAQRWLGFEDAAVSFDHAGTFRARVLVEGPISELSGRFLVRQGLVLTAVSFTGAVDLRWRTAAP